MKGNFINQINDIHENLQLASYLVMKLNAFPLTLRIRQRFLQFLLNIVLEVLASALLEEKELKGI